VKRAPVLGFILAVLASGTVSAWLAVLAADRPAGSYSAEVHVRRVVVDVRVIDNHGRPVTGLVSTDFIVKVDGRPVTSLAADWTIDGREPERFPPPATAQSPVPGAGPAGGPGGPPGATDGQLAAPGRLILFLFERSLEPTRAPNLMRMSKLVSGTIDRLQPTDRVAMLTFDSHLDMHGDFTTDRAALREAIGRAAVPIVRPVSVAAVPPPRLADTFDESAAKDAASPEEALLVIGRALRPIPGPKTMFFFAWGIGRHSALGDDPGPRYDEARAALLAARTSVFTFDVTDADWHSLEGPLRLLCDDTGGMYQKVNLFAETALVKAEAALAGHYVLTFAAPDRPPGHHDIRVRLRKGLHGDILARSGYDD
jgi:VWFA-related protein